MSFNVVPYELKVTLSCIICKSWGLAYFFTAAVKCSRLSDKKSAKIYLISVSFIRIYLKVGGKLVEAPGLAESLDQLDGQLDRRVCFLDIKASDLISWTTTEFADLHAIFRRYFALCKYITCNFLACCFKTSKHSFIKKIHIYIYLHIYINILFEYIITLNIYLQ